MTAGGLIQQFDSGGIKVFWRCGASESCSMVALQDWTWTPLCEIVGSGSIPDKKKQYEIILSLSFLINNCLSKNQTSTVKKNKCFQKILWFGLRTPSGLTSDITYCVQSLFKGLR